MDIVLFVLRILIVIALYAFLGVTLWVLLREGRTSQSTPPPHAVLFRLDNDSAPAQSPAVSYALSPYGPTWIGRDPNCAVRVNNDFVSLRHTRLEWRADKLSWWLEDNSSRNGTLLNDERVAQSEIKDGDVITVGGVSFRFQLGDDLSG